MFFQHAGFLAADAALFADVFPSTASTDVNVVLVGFIPGKEKRLEQSGHMFIYLFFFFFFL